MQEQIHRSSSRPAEETAPPEAKHSESAQRAKADADALLDEIDALLEEQGLAGEAEAQAFIDSYRQKGGE